MLLNLKASAVDSWTGEIRRRVVFIVHITVPYADQMWVIYGVSDKTMVLFGSAPTDTINQLKYVVAFLYFL